MDAFLISQAEIKSRFHPKPKRSREAGKFVSPEMAARIEAARAACKQSLTAEMIALGRLPKHPPPGCTRVKEHARHVGDLPAPLPTLFDRIAA